MELLNAFALLQRKATSVVVTAYQIADAPSGDLDESALDRWRA
jgi:hypothetical protein